MHPSIVLTKIITNHHTLLDVLMICAARNGVLLKMFASVVHIRPCKVHRKTLHKLSFAEVKIKIML